MKGILGCLFGVLVSLTLNGLTRGDELKYAAQAKWARQIVTDYLRLATSASDSKIIVATASGLLSPELTKPTDGITGRIGMFYSASEITKEEVAPDGSEVMFRGVLKGLKPDWRDERWPDADFTIRIARESGGGRWSICFILIQERPPAEKKGK